MDCVTVLFLLYLLTAYVYGFAGLVWLLSEPHNEPLPTAQHVGALVVFAASPLWLPLELVLAVVQYARGKPLC